MEIKQYKITDIKPYDKNAKLHDPKYIDVIINRWEQFTGEKAVLISE